MKNNRLSKSLLGFALFGVISFAAFAVMPPQVYKQAIEASQVKAVAIVRGVTVLAVEEHYISKRVEFELVASYGLLNPGKSFFGYCREPVGDGWVGGDLYYYPEISDKAFVTLQVYNIEHGQEVEGSVTSYTIMTPELEYVLKNAGLDGIEYGMGRVWVGQ